MLAQESGDPVIDAESVGFIGHNGNAFVGFQFQTSHTEFERIFFLINDDMAKDLICSLQDFIKSKQN